MNLVYDQRSNGSTSRGYCPSIAVTTAKRLIYFNELSSLSSLKVKINDYYNASISISINLRLGTVFKI
jgi:hypothetical protein